MTITDRWLKIDVFGFQSFADILLFLFKEIKGAIKFKTHFLGLLNPHKATMVIIIIQARQLTYVWFKDLTYRQSY